MSNTSWSKYEFQQRITLSGIIATKEPWMQEQAALQVDYAILIALLQSIERIKPNWKESNIQLLKDILQRLGHAQWDRSEISHLGERVGDTSSSFDADEPIGTS